MDDARWKIDELAQRAGVTVDTIRYYGREGLLEPPERSGRHKLYGNQHVERLEQRTGKRFGDPHDPLLVSVRSGAAVSMPGMMDTILNVGLSDVAARGLAESTGNPRFAYDSYRRLIQMYGETVDGIDPHRFESALQKLKDDRGARQDVDLTDDDLAQLVETFKEIYEHDLGQSFAQDARDFEVFLAKATKGWNGAEIEQIVVSSVVDAYSENRLLTEDDLHRVISSTVPLSVTMEDQIKAIKSWAHDRALNASRP